MEMIVVTPCDMTESLKNAIALADAAKIIPTRPPIGLIHRWSSRGVRGIRLRTWLVGGKRVTTPAAVEAFLQALNSEVPTASTDHCDEIRSAKQAGAALDALLVAPTRAAQQSRRRSRRDSI